MGISSAILFLPGLTALLIALLPRNAVRAAQGLALLGTAVTCVLAWSLLASFDPAQSAPQFAERLPWVPEIGVTYHVGIDGLSYPMVLLTTLLALVAALASVGSIRHGHKAYFAWFMVMESAILGVFLAQDWFLFYVFWELALIPMFFLIGVWGDEKRGSASMSFFLYTLTGSVLMLIGMMAAYLGTPDHSLGMADIAKAHGAWTKDFQILVFGAFLAGMAVKIPVVPLHGWLPQAHVQAPVPVSMMLSGVLLKMGAYGLFRTLDVAPQGAAFFLPWLFAFGLVSIVYGAFMAWRQDDLKAMVAFSSISHMGFVLVGIASGSATGYTGAMMQMFTHGIVTAALFMLVGVIYENMHSRQLSDLGGAARQAPRYAAVLCITLLAAMGLPGLAGFVSEFHVLVGAYERWGLWVLLAGVGVLVTSAYCLRVFGRVYLAGGDERMRDLSAVQLLALAPLVALMIAIGLYPGVLMKLSGPALDALAVLR